MNVLTGNARTCGDGMENDTAKTISQSPENSPLSADTPTTSLLRAAAPIALTTAPRSSGSSNISNNNLSTKIPGEHLIYRHDDQPSRSLPAVVPHGKIFNLIPRLVTSAKASTALRVGSRNRKPKFVPFEPYKAAISPLVLSTATPRHRAPPPPAHASRNNLDLNTLVQHISTTMKTTSIGGGATQAMTPSASGELDTQRERYERQLAELRRDRDSIAAQLKSQVQVNTELKHLLVAAVGEDLQTRVNHLTEDKLQLARALLSTAENLSSHTEQVEYLAGQSEVWRSKFLASSLMVEELARWKASLQAKNRLLADASRQLLHTVATVRDISAETFGNLRFVAQQRAQPVGVPSSNALDLAAECLNITQQLVLHSDAGGVPAPVDFGALDATTGAEKLALKALSTPDDGLLLRQADVAFRAIVGQAFPVNGKAHPSLPMAEIE